MRIPSLRAILSSLLLISNLSYSQDASTSEAPVIHVSSNFVVLDAIVQDRKTGKSISGLQADDFQLTEGGVRQDISYFSRDQLPHLSSSSCSISPTRFDQRSSLLPKERSRF